MAATPFGFLLLHDMLPFLSTRSVARLQAVSSAANTVLMQTHHFLFHGSVTSFFHVTQRLAKCFHATSLRWCAKNGYKGTGGASVRFDTQGHWWQGWTKPDVVVMYTPAREGEDATLSIFLIDIQDGGDDWITTSFDSALLPQTYTLGTDEEGQRLQQHEDDVFLPSHLNEERAALKRHLRGSLTIGNEWSGSAYLWLLDKSLLKVSQETKSRSIPRVVSQNGGQNRRR